MHLSPRDREQVLLALGSGVLDKGDVVELLGAHENRTGDIDLIVERQRPDHLRRRMRQRREPLGERGTRGTFNIGNEMIEHTVKHRNVFLGKMTRSKDEKIGDAAKRFGTPLGRAAARAPLPAR